LSWQSHGPEFLSETFRVLKNKEIKEHDEYRTQRLVLTAWDQLNPGEEKACGGRSIEDFKMLPVPSENLSKAK
jgi:hypothetical protein